MPTRDMGMSGALNAKRSVEPAVAMSPRTHPEAEASRCGLVGALR